MDPCRPLRPPRCSAGAAGPRSARIARHPAHRDRRRGRCCVGAAVRRAGLGELAVARRLHGAERPAGRPGGAAPGPDAGRSGPPTGCWRSSSSSPGWSSSASSSPATCATRGGPRCRSPPRSAAWSCPALIYVAVNAGAARARCAGLGDPDRHRHRLRAGRARRDQHPPAVGAAHVPAHPRRGRRPARDHDHRGLLHRRRCSVRAARCWRWCRWRLFAVLVQRRVRSWWLLLPLAAADLGAGARVRRARHRRRGAARLRRPGASAAAPGAGPGLAEHFEHRWRPLSAGVAVPVFAFFAAGVTVVGAGGLGASARATRSRSASSSGWSSARPSACSARPGWCSGSPGPGSPTSLGWWDVLGPVAARRDRVHRVAADRRAGVRRRQRARRPRQDRRPARVAARGAARHGRAAAPQPALPADLRRARSATPTPTACPTSTRPTRPGSDAGVVTGGRRT